MTFKPSHKAVVPPKSPPRPVVVDSALPPRSPSKPVVHEDGTGWATKDSGERQEFDTGARRDTQSGKGRYDLLPPLAVRRLAGVYQRGADKYGDRNYEKGIPLTRYIDSALRHTFQLLEGNVDEDHAAQAAWNLLSLIHTQEAIARGLLPLELDDLPDYGGSE